MNKTKLGNIANIITGPFGSQLHMEDYVDAGIPVIMPQNIKGRMVDYNGIAQISEEDFTRLIRYATKENDLIYARRGDVKKHAFILSDSPTLCGTGCLRVRVVDESVYPLFLSFYLNRPETKRWIFSHAVGTNMPNLNTGILADVPVEFPSLNEQIKIAELLQKIDTKINNNNKINDNLQQMAYITYLHMFYGKRPNTKLGDILMEHPKSSIQVSEAKEALGRYPFFTSGDAIFQWDEPLALGRNCFLNTGGNADVKFYVGEAAYSTDTWCITAKDNLSDYLYMLLESIKPELNLKFFQGTGLKHLQKPLLKERPMYVPCASELYVFNNDVQPWLSMISDNIRESKELTALRDWLLPMLMNGQATISD